MKIIIPIMIFIMLACANSAFTQAQTMGAQQQAQQQPPQDGLIFRGAGAVQSVGSYLWGYMPAPLRGADKGYFGAAGSGPTIINFVPGNP